MSLRSSCFWFSICLTYLSNIPCTLFILALLAPTIYCIVSSLVQSWLKILFASITVFLANHVAFAISLVVACGFFAFILATFQTFFFLVLCLGDFFVSFSVICSVLGNKYCYYLLYICICFNCNKKPLTLCEGVFLFTSLYTILLLLLVRKYTAVCFLFFVLVGKI